MTRIASLLAAGSLVLASASTASAQVNLFLGNPNTGRGASLSVGQPTINYGYGYGSGYSAATRGYNYGFGYGGPRVIVANPAIGGVASPYAGYTTQGYTAITPINAGAGFNAADRRYQAGSTYYSSGYSGYSAGIPGYGASYPGYGQGYPGYGNAGSGGVIIQQRYSTSPFNAYGAGAGYNSLYGSGMNSLNRMFGPPLR
jgi:hypothetical protein